jgi:hypothetical protein
MNRILLLTSAALLAAGAAMAQPQMPAPSNLKVLPSDIEPQRLMGMMRNVSAALGVQCTHCHTPPNMASDEKPEKEVARGMIKMVQNIREHGGEFAPDGRADKVGCWTCHRGSAKIEDPPPPPQGGGGGKKGAKKSEN